MDSKLIKQLVEASFVDGKLNSNNVEKIANLLNRKSLKQYIRALKGYERANSVYIDSALPIDEGLFGDLFEDKKIVYNTDSSLLLGMKITNNDLVYDVSLKSKLNTILDKIKENYD